MSGRFVRSSKYRHVFGRPTRKEQCYDNLHISRNAWDTNLVKANPKYISVNWEASGGGAFAVIPINEKGRLPEHLPLFRGHTAVVLDTDWSPFDDSLIASGSDDGKAFIWRVPTDFKVRGEEDEELPDVTPISKLTGHSRKVGHVLFNPAADRVLATSSGDYTIKIWDVDAEAAKLSLKHADIVQGLSWSADGSLLVTTSRDKKLRIWDVRQEKPAHEGPGHAGAKNSRVTWMGEHDRIATTGFSKMSDRQLGLWDLRKAGEPMDGFERLDSISGVCMPFWDDGTQCLYLAGKGDGNIRYFEYQNDRFEFLSEYKSADPQRGIAFLPKRGINVHENEVMRAFKTVNDGYIEPISFIVPRRAEVFQDDIFPPAVGSKAAVSTSEYFSGKTGIPAKIDLAAVYAGEDTREVPSDYKPRTSAPVVAAPTSTAKTVTPESPQKAGESPPTPMPASISKQPLPSMNEQTSSIKDLSAKLQDDSPVEADDDDDSSFEEVAKPIDRSTIPSSSLASPPSTTKTGPASHNLGASLSPVKNKPDDFDTASQIAASQSTATQIQSQAGSMSQLKPEPLPEQLPTTKTADLVPAKSSTSSNSSDVQTSLSEIKSLLAEQSQVMNRQNDTIGKLTKEVETLRAKIGNP